LKPSVVRSLRISNALQVTLDLEQVLRLFSQEVSDYVHHDSLVYENPDADIYMEFGEKAENSCQYELVVSNNNIGSVMITRRQPFDEHAIKEFETLLCSLIYPLLNALLFRDAVESALRDPLTQTLNRSAMLTYATREINLAKRQDTPLSLLLIDLDNFKFINDRFGHTVGDSVIQHVAHRFMTCIRKSDLLFRYGGDEFTVLMSSTDMRQAIVVVKRILRSIREPVPVNGDGSFKLTTSIGVAALRPDDNCAALVKRADSAMYRAKSGGGNTFRIADR
jgi:diguanylate cyclase (GGDEF)-like protein